MRLATAALVGLLGLAACRRTGGNPSDGRILNSAGHAVLNFAGHQVTLPSRDLEGDARPEVTQDASGQRLAYPTKDGGARIVYLIGHGLFVGPVVAQPVDFQGVPDLDHALGPLFEAAGTNRPELVEEVSRVRGDAGVVALLVAAAYVDNDAWDVAEKKLPDVAKKTLGGALANGLEPGKPPIATRRAAQTSDLAHPALVKLVADRAAEPALWAREPSAAATLLRATAMNKKDAAGPIGCAVLAAPTKAPDVLREAAALAVAASGVECTGMETLERVVANACVPYLRCANGKPLGWRDNTKQDEPLCTKAEVDAAVASELAKPPPSAFDQVGARPELFAYAALLAHDHVPSSFLLAHARRRYALTQPAEPTCDMVALGVPCHCDEATIRVNACINASSPQVSVGLCKFDVDDSAKKIGKVVATSPP